MRPIKFRAWDKQEKQMVCDGIVDRTRGLDSDETSLMLEFDGTLSAYINDDGGKSGLWEHSVISESINKRFILMQFTGLFDKNGKEIYEGDIMKISQNCGELSGETVSVVFDRGAFRDSYYHWEINQKKHCLEVIGNIYENKELLK